MKSPPRPRLVLPVCLAQSCSSSCLAPVSLFHCALDLEVQKDPSHGRKDRSALAHLYLCCSHFLAVPLGLLQQRFSTHFQHRTSSVLQMVPGTLFQSPGWASCVISPMLCFSENFFFPLIFYLVIYLSLLDCRLTNIRRNLVPGIMFLV